MLSIQLTAAGRLAPPPTPRAEQDAYAEWKRYLQAMLTLAVSTKPTRDRLNQMQAWIDEHDEFDAHYAERCQQHHLELVGSYVAENAICDLSEKVAYWQHQLSTESIAKIEGWLGVELQPNVGYRWAKTAQWVGSVQLPELVKIGGKRECPF